MRITDRPSGQASFGHLLIHGLKIQRSHSGQNSVTENGSDVPVQHPLIILKGFRSAGTDFILYDPFTKCVFPMNEKVTVLDATTGDSRRRGSWW